MEDITHFKICCRCNLKKDLNSFYFKKNGLLLRSSKCISCESIYRKNLYLKKQRSKLKEIAIVNDEELVIPDKILFEMVEVLK